MAHVKFTTHATEKFDVLKRYGFEITSGQVNDTLLNPEAVSPQPGDTFIAQRGITERHVLRVVYRMEGEDYVVITFYPGRRERYENPV